MCEKDNQLLVNEVEIISTNVNYFYNLLLPQNQMSEQRADFKTLQVFFCGVFN